MYTPLYIQTLKMDVNVCLFVRFGAGWLQRNWKEYGVKQVVCYNGRGFIVVRINFESILSFRILIEIKQIFLSITFTEQCKCMPFVNNVFYKPNLKVQYTQEDKNIFHQGQKIQLYSRNRNVKNVFQSNFSVCAADSL